MSCLRPDLAELSPYHLAPLPANICKLDANESPLDLPVHIKQKLAQLVAEDMHSNRYPDGIYAELKTAIAEYVGCNATWVSLGNGSDELIRSLLLIACLGRGGILIAEPTFSMYGILAQTLGIKVYRSKRDHLWAMDLTDAEQLIAKNNISAVFVVNPNSPTGNLLTTQEIDWLGSLPSSILVVIDEAYFEYAGISLFPHLQNHPNWVILRTFSKAFRLASYRVGYGIAHPEIITNLEKVRLPYNLSVLSARSAQLAIQYRQELLATIPETIAVREEFYQFLKNLDWRVWPSWANFLYCQTDSDQRILETMRSQGVLIRQTGGGLRITIGTAEEMEQCKKAILACKKLMTS
ncbi:MAG: histidinol-phosphate transaminase [Pseudanabaenaceae cyanobacterium]